jgi:hypothetical protein
MLYALLGTASVSVALGCSGGGGGGNGGTSPTPVPSALSIATRPLASGQTFAYSGTTLDSFVFSGASPEPQSTTAYAVAQNSAVSGPVAYDGAASTYDVHTVETDTSPLQTLGLTTDTYDALVASGTTTNLVTYGFTSTASSGETLAVTIPNVDAGNGILDELPEKAGAAWTNGAAQNVSETSPGGLTSQRAVAANGSYTDTTTFSIGSIYASPIPGGPLVSSATITQNADGSGSYVFDGIVTQGGSPVSLEELDFATPAPASSGQPATIAISEPQASAAPIVVTIPLWYPQPLSLYTETDVDDGSTALPAACKVPAALGTTANAVVQTITAYDTIVGTQENFEQTSYVVPTYGLACVTLNETLRYFYDYSGQTNLENLVPNANVTATATYPIETETIATTLGLTSANVGATAAQRVSSARASFTALVEREKSRRKALLLQKLRRALAAGAMR